MSTGNIDIAPMGSYNVDPHLYIASVICAAVEQGGVDYPYDPGYRFAAERDDDFLLVTIEHNKHSIFAFGTAASDERADAGWMRMQMLRTTGSTATQRPASPWSASCVLNPQAFLQTDWLLALQKSIAAAWVQGYEYLGGVLDKSERTKLPSRLAMQFEHSPPFGAVKKEMYEPMNLQQRKLPGKRPSRKAKVASA